MSISTRLEAMVQTLNALSVDAHKADKGNKSAGTRVRKGMQEIVAECKEIRKEVLEIRNKED